ncbi:TonB-dependent receptor, partial [Rheinheimera sp.]|uniref:TonB-dependent receptor plug domain-containing protein n=1 Tax=Rheinheimera sp. TaxID=1869214 RepID=UPI00261D2D21
MHKRNALSLAIAMACVFSAAAQQADVTNSNSNTAAATSKAVANDTELEVISVTATKRKTKLMETPVAISALSEAQLQQNGVNNVVDIANLVPGLDIAVSSEQAAPVITMRGIRSTNITELGDPAVGVHLDGIYSPRMQGALALMYDVERVEALRGPQGTLFGRNSTVGSINVLTAKPDLSNTFGNLNTEMGKFNAKSVGGMFNLAVSDDFAVRFSGKGLKRDSYVEGYFDPNQYDTRYLPAGVL